MNKKNTSFFTRIQNSFSKLNLPLAVVVILISSFPLVTFAVSANLNDVIKLIITLLKDYILKLIFALAFVYFMWGVVQYALYPDGESKDKGKQAMIWGLIALTVMFSVYGLIRIALGTFGVNETEIIKAPTLPESQ